MSVAEVILQQLGGNKFTAMTGSYNYISDGNTLRMSLRKNKSKANRLFITLEEGKDTYIMKFFKIKTDRIDPKTFAFIKGETIPIKEFEDVYFDDLQSLFTSVTGMATYL